MRFLLAATSRRRELREGVAALRRRGRTGSEDLPREDSEEVLEAETDMAGDRVIGYSTWKWFDSTEDGGRNVYRYCTRTRDRDAPRWAKRCRGSRGVVRGQNSNAAAMRQRARRAFGRLEYAWGTSPRTRSTRGRRRRQGVGDDSGTSPTRQEGDPTDRVCMRPAVSNGGPCRHAPRRGLARRGYRHRERYSS